MPTATEYRAWATTLEGHEPTLGTLLNAPLGIATPDALAGGRLSVVTDLTLRASQDNSMAAAGLVAQLADECTRRAAICDEYELAWQDYERQAWAHDQAMDRWVEEFEAATADGRYVASPPAPPLVPRPPHDWVERA